MGSKIIEGFISPQLKKFEKYVKNFKHVASFSYLQKGETGKMEVGFCKIPFPRETELNEFEKTFNDILSMLAEEGQKNEKTN